MKINQRFNKTDSRLQHQTRMLEQQFQQFKMADHMQNGHMILVS